MAFSTIYMMSFRNLLESDSDHNSVLIDGPGKIVEVHESHLVTRKHKKPVELVCGLELLLFSLNHLLERNCEQNLILVNYRIF